MADDLAGSSRVFLELPGRFQPRRYVIGHSELEIRSVPGSHRMIRLRFFGVLGVKLRSGYDSLTVHDAGEPLRSDVLAFTGVAGRPSAPRVRVLALSQDSFVACLSLVAREYTGPDDTDGTLILRTRQPADG